MLTYVETARVRTSRKLPVMPVPSLREAGSYFIRLLILCKPHWRGLTGGLLLGLIGGVFGLISPYFSKLYFDKVYPARDVQLLHMIIAAVIVTSLAGAFMATLRGYYSQVISSRLGSAMSLMYFNHLQHLPIRFFDEHRVGEIMSRLGDMRAALGTVGRVFQTVLVNGVYVVLVPPFLMLLNWKLSLLALVTTPVTTCVTTLMSRVTRRFMKEGAEASAELNAIQVEVMSQIRTLKVMGVEDWVFRDLKEQSGAVVRLSLRTGTIAASVGLANALVRTAGTALFSWYAWTLILRGDLTLGSFVAFSAYLGYLTGPVGQMTGLFADFQQSAVTLGRAFEYLDIAPEQNPALAYEIVAPPSRRVTGHIEFSSVVFGYAQGQRVLRGLSFSSKPGHVTAIVGESGAGKSTILRLLTRMEHPSSGSITIDGVPITQFDLRELRRQMAVVWQEPTLLRGTIWENLTYGQPDAPRERVEEAIEIARLSDMLRQLPEGYETMVAEWGATVSGGQRQRFALARALIRDAPILLLDEATSQVDVRTEEAILRDLMVNVRDRAVIFVTHRIATAALADQICVMEDGVMVANGAHGELAMTCDPYRQMLQAWDAGDERRHLRVVNAI